MNGTAVAQPHPLQTAVQVHWGASIPASKFREGPDLARDHADRLVGDGPGDAGGGLAAVAVAVQP
jgi:hypothetical protein